MSSLSDNHKAGPSDEKQTPPPTVPGDSRFDHDQARPLDDEEQLDEALDETFPASDPIAPSRIDGPGN